MEDFINNELSAINNFHSENNTSKQFNSGPIIEEITPSNNNNNNIDDTYTSIFESNKINLELPKMEEETIEDIPQEEQDKIFFDKQLNKIQRESDKQERLKDKQKKEENNTGYLLGDPEDNNNTEDGWNYKQMGIGLLVGGLFGLSMVKRNQPQQLYRNIY
jgi:hypothetical protein